jgi:(R,R)-butanediol dehydrogenase/meso-butanediol dehydrogenase/diacetyl reductase
MSAWTRYQSRKPLHTGPSHQLEQVQSGYLHGTSTCGRDEVRLKVAFCGICGTDLHEYMAGPIFVPPKGTKDPHTGAELPVTLGHEFCGTVDQVGADVDNFVIGQKVAVNPAMDDRHHGHGACEQCLAGCQNRCKRLVFYGLSQGQGGFAEHIVIKPVALIPLPQNISLKLASLAEPLAVAAHMIRISGFRAGQNVLVLGTGPIGCALIMLLRAKGAAVIVASEVAESRAAQAESFGADVVVNPMAKSSPHDSPTETTFRTRSNPVLDTVRRMMGAGAHVSFDACGLQSTLDTAIECTKPGGTIFNVAIHDKALCINLNTLVVGEKHLTGGNAYTPEDFEEVMTLLSTHADQAARLVTSVVPLSNAVQGGFHELINNAAAHVKILIEACGEET